MSFVKEIAMDFSTRESNYLFIFHTHTLSHYKGAFAKGTFAKGTFADNEERLFR